MYTRNSLDLLTYVLALYFLAQTPRRLCLAAPSSRCLFDDAIMLSTK